MKKTLAIVLSAATVCAVMLSSGCGRNRMTGNHSDGRPSNGASQTDGALIPGTSDDNNAPDGY